MGAFLFGSDRSWNSAIPDSKFEPEYLVNGVKRGPLTMRLDTRSDVRFLDDIGLESLAKRIGGVFYASDTENYIWLVRQLSANDLKSTRYVADDLLLQLMLEKSPPKEIVQQQRSGTGWICPGDLVVTCLHVVNGAKSLTVESATIRKTRATVVYKKPEYDLAVLRLSSPPRGLKPLSLEKTASAMGESVFTAGYPHIELMGQEPKLTEGTVSAVTGIKDDPRTLQISVPVQSGNSGGPLVNMRGNVVGIVSSKLAAAKVFNWTGDLPQNVNYAVKIAPLAGVLQRTRVNPFPSVGEPKEKDLAVLADKVKKSVVLIVADE